MQATRAIRPLRSGVTPAWSAPTRQRGGQGRLAPTLAAALLIAAALAPPTAAQTAPEPPTPETALAPLFEALAARADGTAPASHIRIGWWGDSALVGDGYTGELRARLQAAHGDGGPGFLLAAPAFDGYVNTRVRMKRFKWETESLMRSKGKPFGLGGVAATSWGGSGSTFNLSDGTSIDRVHVFYRAKPKGGELQLYLDGGKAVHATRSTAVGAEDGKRREGHWELGLPAAATEVKLRAAGGGHVRVYGAALERSQGGVVLDTLGVLGMRARRLRNQAPKALAQAVAARSYALVALAFGGNERVDPGLTVDGHAAEIREAIQLLRAGAPKAACLVVGPLSHGERVGGREVLDPKLATVVAGQRKAAAAEGCAFVDMVALMGGDDSVRLFRSKGWMGKDLGHLNGKGHREVGRRLAEWFDAAFARWKAAR